MADFGTFPVLDDDRWDVGLIAWRGKVETAVNAVETKANAALPIKGSAGAIHLNALVEPGIYRQSSTTNATKVNGYPIDGHTWVIEVFHWDVGAPMQRLTPITGTSGMRGFIERRIVNSAQGVWGSFVFVPSQRVDQTAGRAIYVWDFENNREQLVYEDTGRRNITAVLPEITSGFAYISRTAYGVTLTLQDAVLGTSSGTVPLTALPAAFSPAGSEGYVAATGSGAFRRVQMQSNGVLRVFGVVSGDALNGTFYWRTYNARPTSDLGNAVGTVPNA